MKPQNITGESLLTKALQFEEVGPPAPRDNTELLSHLELAIAYHERKIYAGAVASVLGGSTKTVSAWFSSIILKGIRAGLVEIKLKPPTEAV